METEDRPAPPPPTPGGTSRRAAVAAIAAALLLVVAVVAVFATRGDGDAAGSTAPEPPPSQTTTAAATTTTTIDTETEVVARLREILRVRDRALETRNPNLLASIYTVDCPCLTGDRDAIRRLRHAREVWLGVSTSIRVQKLERINANLWIINAFFVAAPFNVESESGDLIRKNPEERHLSRFVLARLANDGEWLLGHVSLIERPS
jgi:hypothetical protein